MMWMILHWMHAALTADEARAWPQKQKLPLNHSPRPGVTKAEKEFAIVNRLGLHARPAALFAHCSHLFIRPPSTWTIPSTAPIGVAPPKRGCRFA
jgi:PTS HPr component phosphorylation site